MTDPARRERAQLTSQWLDTIVRPDIFPPPVETASAGSPDNPVQMRGGTDQPSNDIHQLAGAGTSGAPTSLPHGDRIQQSFGRLDVSDVQAHVGGPAAESSQAMGAEAYATGNHVAFRRAPDLHTAAHEVAHVVQQRTSVQLQGGVGRAGDTYERHADAVADRVVRGESAEALLDDEHGGAHVETASALQMKKVERDTIPQNEIAAAGAGASLDEDQIAKAITWNDKKWKGDHRYQIIVFLRGTMGPLPLGVSFAKEDVERVAKLQKGAGVPDEKVDGMIGDTTMSIFLHSGLTLSKVEDVQPSDVRFVFYPGEFEDIKAWEAARDAGKAKDGSRSDYNEYRSTVAPDGVGKLYVEVKGNLVDKMDVRGGPPIKLVDGTHTADPSKPGTYELDNGAPYRTNSWYNSQIRWGAEIRERSDREIEFKDPGSSRWKVATGPDSVLKTPMRRSDFDDKAGGIVKEWNKNDFGAEAWRVKASPGLFIHTTPYSETLTLAGQDPELSHSHGCLHVKPAERDHLKSRGYLQGGVTLVIKSYESHLLPDHMRAMMESPTPLTGSSP